MDQIESVEIIEDKAEIQLVLSGAESTCLVQKKYIGKNRELVEEDQLIAPERYSTKVDSVPTGLQETALFEELDTKYREAVQKQIWGS